MNANQRTYGYRDLIRTYILEKRFENAAPPLRGYYSELYSILSSFFGVDLDRIQEAEDLRVPRAEYTRLFQSCLESYKRAHSPFSSYIEVTRQLARLYETHGRKLDYAAEKYKDACLDLMCEIYCLVYGPTESKITSDELKDRGFDDSEEPYEFDFI